MQFSSKYDFNIDLSNNSRYTLISNISVSFKTITYIQFSILKI